MSNEKGVKLSSIKWYHALELILPAFLFLAPLILSINDAELFGINATALFTWYGSLIGFIIILGFITYKQVDRNDFRFKLFIHILVIGLSTTISGLLLPGSGILVGFQAGFQINLLRNFLVIIVPLIIVSVGAIQAAYKLIDPFSDNVADVTNQFKTGNLSTQIEDKVILEDTVFGPIAMFINEILTYSKNVIENMTETANVIASSSEKLALGSASVNSSAEQVATTSQAMSAGATTQTELITDVNSKIFDLKNIMDTIISKIQMNTKEVSQIALQTNILALNAGIEASRAGDYGRGFAVVAENVRKLSDQSKIASERIEVVADEINHIIMKTINEITSVMLNVVSVSEETAASAEEVAAAAQEMTATMFEVNLSTQDLSNQAGKAEKLLSNLKSNKT